LRLRQLSELCLQQSARTVGWWNLHIEVPPAHSDKFADRRLDFLFACPTGPTGGKMRLDALVVSRGKLAIDSQKQFLIGEMRFLRQHNFTVRRRGRSVPEIVPGK